MKTTKSIPKRIRSIAKINFYMFSLISLFLILNSCATYQEAWLNPETGLDANIPNLTLVIDSLGIEKTMGYSRWVKRPLRLQPGFDPFLLNYMVEDHIELSSGKDKFYDLVSEDGTPFVTKNYLKHSPGIRIHRLTLNSPPKYAKINFGKFNETSFIDYPEFSFHSDLKEITIEPKIPFAKGEELLTNIKNNPEFFSWWNKDGTLYHYVDSIQNSSPNLNHYYIIGFKKYYDKIALDMETLLGNYLINNVIDQQGPTKGIVEVSLSKNYHKVNKGYFILSTLTLYTVNLLGFPMVTQKYSMDVNVRIKNNKGETIKEYTEEGKGKATSAIYWGYTFVDAFIRESSEGLPRVVKTLALTDALDKIRNDIMEDSAIIKKALE